MILGYNTNGWAHHDPRVAIELLAEIGYGSVALTIDHGVLNPYDGRLAQQITQMRDCLQRHNMTSVIETGARFLLDPRVKHEPTLLSGDAAARARRIDFLRRAIDIASELGSDCVSLWSGVLREPLSHESALERLAQGLRPLIDHAAERQVTLAFEPEPGMFVDTMDQYAGLLKWVDAPNFCLTLDVGHLHCVGEVPIAAQILRWRSEIVNVHIEDMRSGVHDHLMFGEGEIDFPPVIAALAGIGYAGGLHVELSRHSHEAPIAAQRAYEFLRPLIDGSRRRK